MFRPNILANGYADFFPVDNKRFDGVGRFEIALLVENIVGRQKRFVSFTDRFAAFEQSGGVAKRFAASLVAINEAYQQGCLSNAGVEFLQQFQIFRNKARFENQILRRISGDRQLRCQDEFCARRGEPFIGARDQFAISPQISHSQVNLSETNLHAVLRQITLAYERDFAAKFAIARPRSPAPERCAFQKRATQERDAAALQRLYFSISGAMKCDEPRKCVLSKSRELAGRLSWWNEIFPSRSLGGCESKSTRAAFVTAIR